MTCAGSPSLHVERYLTCALLGILEHVLDLDHRARDQVELDRPAVGLGRFLGGAILDIPAQDVLPA